MKEDMFVSDDHLRKETANFNPDDSQKMALIARGLKQMGETAAGDTVPPLKLDLIPQLSPNSCKEGILFVFIKITLLFIDEIKLGQMSNRQNG